MATMQDLVRSVRRKLRDAGAGRSRLVADIDGITQTLQLPAGQSMFFPQPNKMFEFDDGTDERCYSEAAGNVDDTLTNVQRGVDGTAPVVHVANTPILIEPRVSAAEIIEQVNHMIDAELWPMSWIAGVTTLDYQAANEYFSPAISGIEKVVYAYQLVSGVKYKLHTDFLPATLAGDPFPNGAVTIRFTADNSQIYVAYRARATLATLTPVQRKLVPLGAAAQLMIAEEAQHVAPASSYIDRRVTDGAKARAGQLLWQQFQAGIYGDFVDLKSEEDEGRREFSRAS